MAVVEFRVVLEVGSVSACLDPAALGRRGSLPRLPSPAVEPVTTGLEPPTVSQIIEAAAEGDPCPPIHSSRS
jgi:hypothetical protein